MTAKRQPSPSSNPAPISSPAISVPSEAETAEMLKTVGATSLDDFIAKVVPEEIRSSAAARSARRPRPSAPRSPILRKMAERNEVFTSMIGMGYYGTVTPKVILRNVLENPGWYTAYTPYQAEVSQGRLEALLNFQQMVDRPDRPANWPMPRCSMKAPPPPKPWPWPSAWSKTSANTFFVDRDTHPQTIGVIETRARAFGYRHRDRRSAEGS